MSGNTNIEISVDNALLATDVVEDRTAPVLTNFTLDLTSETMTLFFTETVRSSTLEITQFLLLAEPSSMISYQFTGGLVESDDSDIIIITLTTTDLNQLKNNSFLATSINDTYLSHTEYAVQDMNDNYVNSLPTDMAIQAYNVTTDIIHPQLQAFDLDMNTGTLTLSFSEIVNVSTLDVSLITIQSRRTSSVISYNLTGGIYSETPSPVVTISLTATDLNMLKKITDLAISFTTTYISLAYDTVCDLASDLPIDAIASTDAQIVQLYTQDSTPPTLVCFDFNLDNDIIFYFDETVLASSLDPTQITLVVEPMSSITYQFIGGERSTEDSTNLTLQINEDDKNSIKRTIILATSNETTYISFTSRFIQDMNSIYIIEKNISYPIRVCEYTGDTMDPQLQSFSLDMDSTMLYLTFTETINASSVDTSQFVLIDENSGTSYNLTGGDMSNYDDTDITVNLTDYDANNIKALLSLAQDEATTSISISEYAARDMAGLNVQPILLSSPLPVAPGEYTPDITGPSLLRFDLDVDSSLLTLTFDETVDASSLRLYQLTLQSHMTPGEENYTEYTLRQRPIGLPDSPILLIYLDFMDIRAIKEDQRLATTPNNTYLFFRVGSVTDTALQPNFAFENILQVTNYTFDSTGPNITSFAVDMAMGTITINFDEPVSVQNLNMTGLTAISGPNGSNYTFMEGMTTSTDDFVITIVLDNDDLNRIKQIEDLWTSLETTYISVEDHFITDPKPPENPVLNITTDDPLRASLYFNDTSTPVLQYYDLNMDAQTVDLYFSETINISTFDFSGIAFQNVPNTFLSLNPQVYQLTNGTILTDGDVAIVQFMFDRDDLNQIKFLEIANNENTVYLTLRNTTVQDQNDNYNQPRQNGINTIRPRMYTRDMTDPVLESFDLNLTADTLTLHFDETVRTDTLNVTQITLYNDNNTNQYELTIISYSATENDPNIVIYIGELDANNIKREIDLAIDSNNTYLSITTKVIDDMVGNPAQPIFSNMTIQVSDFFHDEKRPVLREFDLDFTNETLTLSFSETVNVTSFDPTQITLLEPNGDSYNLTDGDILHEDDPIVTVNLVRFDTDIIKQKLDLATNENNTMLSITNLTIQDMNDNYVIPINFTEALNVSNFTADMVNPYLESFDLDMDASTITLSFSETVNSSSLNVTSIVFQDANALTPANYRLTDGYTLSIDGSVIVVNITKEDLDLIKQDVMLATNQEDTYLSFDSSLISDMFGNPVIEITDNNATKVDNYTTDTTDPYLESYNLDINTGFITLTFSETVNAYTFDASQLTLQAMQNTTDNSSNYIYTHPLNGGYTNTTTINTTVVTIQFLTDDFNEIKRLFRLATEEDNTFVTHTAELVYDMSLNNNPSVPIVNGEALMVTNFTEDETNPVLYKWEIDMDAGTMLLMFDETINRDSIDYTQFTLQDDTSPILDTHTLNGGSSDPINATTLQVNFTVDDLNQIKRKRICTDRLQREDCYLSWTNTTIEDMNGNPVVERSLNDSLMASDYIPDDTEPELVSFVLFDFNNETITLEFSETVNVSSFDVTQVTLKRFVYNPRSGQPFQFLNLTGSRGILTETDNTSITFRLTVYDLNRIKEDTFLCVQVDGTDCYIEFSPLLLQDMAENSIVQIDGEADRVAGGGPSFVANAEDVIPDQIPPTLVNYSINLDVGNITLTFDETVNHETFNPTAITFHNSLNSTESHTLTGGETVTTRNWIYLHFNFTHFDLVALKYMEDLATNMSNTFISITEETIMDMGLNPNPAAPTELDDSLQPWDYVEDTTEPTLLSFRLDLGNDILYLTFDEPVRVNSTIPTNITLQSRQDSGTGVVYQLTGGTPEYQDGFVNKSHLELHLTAIDMRNIKVADLAENQFTTPQLQLIDTYLSLARGTILDTAGNPVVEIPSNSAIIINDLIVDTFLTFIVEFDLDLDRGTITFVFEDVVDQDSFNPTQLTIHNTTDYQYSNNFTLTGGTLLTILDDYVTVWQLSMEDLNELKRNEGLATDANTTYITHTSDLIDDELDLAIIPIPVIGGLVDEEAKQVRNFTEDTSSPHLVSFNLDMNIGMLYLTFNETVKANTLNLTLITFQNVEIAMLAINSTEYEDPDVLHYTLTGGNHTEDIDSIYINASFSKFDFDEIKRIFGLAISQNTTFIIFPNDTLLDMNRNNIVPITTTSAQMVDVFTNDSTPPYLISWELDMDVALLTLYFPETMDVSSFNVTELRIQSAVNSSIGFNLRGGNSTQDDGLVIIVNITKLDLDEIKRIEEIATSYNDTYLSFSLALVHDMNFNYIVPLHTNNSQQVSNFTEDTTQPELVSYDLDMVDGILIMTFSETVNATSIKYTYFTLLSGPFNDTDSIEPGNSFTLTEAMSSENDSTFINITFSKEDFDEIKRLYELAISNETTYLAILEDGIRDQNNNTLVQVEVFDPRLVRIHIPDDQRPELESFDLDMDNGILLLTFSETVDVTTFDVTQITFQDRSAFNISNDTVVTNYTLTGGEYTMENSTIIQLNITLEDLNNIKQLPPLVTEQCYTFISSNEMLIMDMNDNSIWPILADDPLIADNYTEDTTRPTIDAFNLNLTSEIMTLIFSETVNTSSLDLSQIVFHYAANTSYSYRMYALSSLSSYTNTSYNHIVTIYLGLSDLNELKRIRGLVTDQNTTFISYSNTTVLDMKDNEVVPRFQFDAQQVDEFFPDEIRPQLTGYEVNIDEGYMILNFTETIDILSLNISLLTLQPMENSTEENNFTYTLNHGTMQPYSFTTSNDSETVFIQIGIDDLNAIKKIKEVARNENETYLSFPEEFISDMFANRIVPITTDDARQVEIYTPDVTGPVLVDFSLNMTSELLVLTFDETIDASTLNITYLTLQSSDVNASSYYQLTNTTYWSMEDSTIVSIKLAKDDLDEIKLQRELASDPNNTYLLLSIGTILDTALEPNMNQLFNDVATSYGFDTTPPMLLRFSVDITRGTLVLNFDEPIDATTLNFTGLILQSTNTTMHMSQMMRLNGGYSNDSDGLQITVTFLEDDLNSLKQNDILYISLETAYLALDSFFVMDMAGNQIKPIIDGDALLADSYRNDTIMPVLEGYNLDMNIGLLTLYFSETVNASSLQFDQLILQRSPNITSGQYTYQLTGGNFTILQDDTVLYVQITLDDLNAIKARTIADSENTTWLVFPETALQDMNQQMVFSQVNGYNASRVTNYIEDTTAPVLLHYSLDLNNGILSMYFSETVNTATVNATSLILQNSQTRNLRSSFNYYRLTTGSITNNPVGPVFNLSFSSTDLNALKASPILATIVENTYITVLSSFLSDMVGNYIAEVPQELGQQARTVYPDLTNPELVHFDLNLTSEVMVLTFSETVKLSTIVLSEFTLLEDIVPFSVPGDSYTLTGGRILNRINSPIVEVALILQDLNIIKEKFTLAVSDMTTHLSITQLTVQDMSGLPVVPISNSPALMVSSFYRDFISPRLLAFDLDMDGPGSLTLELSETVNVESLIVTEITIQDNTTALISHHLTDQSTSNSSNGTTIIIDFSIEDSNRLKQLDGLAISDYTSFLTLSTQAVKDMNMNGIEAIADRSGVNVRTYTPDTTAPELIGFDLDLTNGNITLTFSETIRARTLQPTQLTLQDARPASDVNGNFTLSGGSWDRSFNSHVVVFYISGEDLNDLKRYTMVASNENNTYISITNNFIRDMNNNQIREISNEAAIKVTDYDRDSITPTLTSFIVDMDAGILALTFDEAVNISTLRTTEFTILDCCYYASDTNMTTYNYTLTGGECVGDEQTRFTCSLTDVDLNEIKRLPICMATNDGQDCCLSLSGDAIKDLSGNSIEPVFEGCGFEPTMYTSDTNPPYLVEFSEFNLDSRTVQLLFNETINASSIDLSKVTFQSFYRNAQMSYTLTGGSVTTMDSTIVIFNLTMNDTFAIQETRGLCSDINNCWISLASGFVRDRASNLAVVIPTDDAKDAISFVDDMTSPTLIRFDLDLTDNTLTLYFDEAVDSASLDVSAATILNNPAEDALAINLTRGSTASPDGLVIVADIDVTDTNTLRAVDHLATSENDTYISITQNLITDAVRRVPNPINNISLTNALPVTTFVADMIPPRLLSFSTDLDEDVLVLTFNEPVRVSTIITSFITILSSNTMSPDNQRALGGGTVEADSNSSMVITVSLIQPDIRYLKLFRNIATSIADTWLSVTTGAIEDMAGNLLVGIPFTQALQTTSFVEDIRKASLISFDFDIDAGQLHLTFDDIINASSFVSSALTIQNTAELNDDFATLTSGSSSISENGYFITINISSVDLNLIKLNTELATDENNTYVSIRAEAFDDNFGENIVPVTSNEGLKVTNYTSDTSGPILLSFDLDMNLQIIHLTFDETVNVSTLDEQQITLQSTSNIMEGTYYTITDGDTRSGNSDIVSIYLSINDFNEITRLSSLAVSNDTTYISLTSFTIQDMNSNAFVTVYNSSAIRVNDFTPDTTPPSLVSFYIDLTEETLVLTFNETVNASSIDTTQFTVQGSPIQRNHRTLQDRSASENDSTVVIIYLGLADLNEIKRLTDVGTIPANTFLSITRMAIADMNGNQVNEISPSQATLQATNVNRDTIPPRLLEFNLDLTREILTLKFSETVRVSTIVMSLFSLQSTPNETSSTICVPFTGGIARSQNYHVIDMELTMTDFNEITRITGVATSEENTYLSAMAHAIEDMSGNPLVAVPKSTPVSIDILTNDSVMPNLTSFDLDLNVGQITLTFDETVNLSSFAVTQITLQNNITLDPSASHQLSNLSYSPSTDSNVVQIILDPSDLNEIKRLDRLATDLTDTYISITSDLVTDMNNNPVYAILDNDALPVFMYIMDMMPPMLVEFDLSLNSSQLILRFNETVESDSLDVTSLTIQSSQTTSAQSVTLTNTSRTLSPDGTMLLVEISEVDLNDIKRITLLATDENNTFISLSSSAVRDMSNNSIVTIPTTDALRVTEFTADMIHPQLREFDLDMDFGTLTLSFTETVQVNSLNVSSITFYSSDINSTDQYTLTDSSFRVTYSDEPTQSIFIHADDLNVIKQLYNLATSENNTYISLSSGGVLDMTDLPILEAIPIKVNEYTADSTPPTLQRFSLNLTSEVLSLTFEETVNTASLNITYLTLFSEDNTTVASEVRLEHYRSITDENSTTIDILLALDHLHDIKLDTELATSMDNTFLHITDGAVHDMALMPNYFDGDLRQVANFWPDETDPELQRFMVNMNDGSITIIFDEPINVTSINYEAFTLHSMQYITVMDDDNTTNTTDNLMMEMMLNENYTNFTLTGGYTNSSNNLQITFYFTEDDLNDIKREVLLFTSLSTSFLSIESSAISDMAGNPVVPITRENAENASFFITDMTLPILTNFSLDMDSGLLLTTFSETVDVSTLMFTSLTIQKGPNVTMEANYYTLTNGSLTMTEDHTIAYIMLTDEDLNELKRKRIALTPETTWLLLENGTIHDMNELPVVAIMNPFAIMVMNYTADTTDPELDFFVLDLDNETLILTFSETVDVYMFNVTAITLQDTQNGTNMFNHFTLTENSQVNSPTMHVITIVLGLEDLNRVKQILELATTENNTYINIESYLVRDVFGNPIIAIDPDDALMADDLIVDQTSPVLQAFNLDLDDQTLTLFFSETVNVTSLNISGITLVSSREDDSQYYFLQSSYTVDNDTDIVTIILDITDFNEIKKLTGLATTENNTYISIENFTIADVFSNLVEAISFADAQLVTNYTKDVTSPELYAYHLDMNAVTLTLEFTETVNISSLDVTAITFVNSNDTMSIPISYTLMNSGSLSENGPEIVINFTSLDENNLKRVENLATSLSNTFVLISDSLIEDMDGNPVRNVTAVNALCCIWLRVFPINHIYRERFREFTNDSTDPVLVSYNLDLNSDTLELTFTETVNASSWYIPGIALQNEEEAMNTTTYYQLTDSNFSTYNDPMIDIYLSRTDRDEIRRLTSLAINNLTTYLTIATDSILDMVGLGISPIFNTSARNVDMFTPDDVNPYLEYFELDLTEETLTLQFSETMNIATVDVTGITLTSDEVGSVTYTLTGGIVQNNDHNSTIVIILTTTDLNEIKVRTSLAISNTTTYLLITNYTIQDVSMNQVMAITTPVIVGRFTEDTVRPQLEAYTLDVNMGVLTLTFSETVNSNSLNVTGLTIQSHPNISDIEVEYQVLSDESFTDSMNGTEIAVTISLQDLNVIKQLTGLATSNISSYLSIENYTIVDMNNNMVESVETSSAKMVDIYINDMTPPELVSVILDLTNEILILSFTETVNASSIYVNQFTIQNSQTSAANSIELTESNSTDLDNDTITISINQNDLNLIKSNTELGITPNDTFVAITMMFISDMAGNTIEPIESNDALMALDVLRDETEPELISFNFDLNQGIITFVFSEAVDISSLNLTEVTLQNQSNATLSTYYTIIDHSTEPVTYNERQTVVSVTLTNDDLNNIKQREDLATLESGNDTFISFPTDFITDTTGNPIIPILLSEGQRVDQFVPDTSCPYVVTNGFVLDLDNGTLILRFSETIRVSSINYTQITIQNSATLPISTVPLTGGSSDSSNGPEIVIKLTRDDLDSIKINNLIGNNLIETFISFSELSLRDMADNSYCNDTGSVQAVNVIADITPPELDQYNVDLDAETVLLNFSEAVRLPINVSEITFHGLGGTENSTYYSLTEGMSVHGDKPYLVILHFSQVDLNRIKSMADLVVSEDTTFISITSDTAVDYSENQVVNISLEMVTTFNPDGTRPSLSLFNLDMNSDTLVLSFTEYVNVSTVNVTAITLQGSSSSDSDFYTLRNSTISQDSLTSITVSLSTLDSHAIKLFTSIATLQSNTHISITEELVQDASMLNVNPVNQTDTRMVTGFVGDTTEPNLLYFNLNLTTEILCLTFDEPVNAESLQFVNSLHLQSDLDGNNSLAINNAITISNNSAIICIMLGDNLLHEIKRNTELATDENNTCLSISDGAVTDLSNTNRPVLPDVLCASGFTNDSVRPMLIMFGVDVNASTLTIVFDEPINTTSIVLTELTLQAAMMAADEVEEFTLTGGDYMTEDQLTFVITLNESDANAIKQLTNLLRSNTTSYIRITSEFAVDMNDNMVQEINASMALQAISFIDDTTRPVFEGFDLDMNTGLLVLHFSETVNATSIDFTGITFRQQMGMSSPQHTLTNGTLVSTNNSRDVYILLTNDDLNELKTLEIGRDNSSAYVVVDSDTIVDIVNQQVFSNMLTPRLVSEYTIDDTPPMLESFHLDFTAQTLTLYFNETVDRPTLDVTEITLCNSNTSSTSTMTYTLTNVSTSQSENKAVIDIDLGLEDLNELKRMANLATTINDTFIHLTNLTISDTFGNQVVPISADDKLQATDVTNDDINPVLEGFELDMNTGVLTLSFSETVNSATLNTSGITLYSSQIPPYISYALSGPYVTVSSPMNIIQFEIVNSDLNEIKFSRDLATSDETTFLSIMPFTIRDMDGNFVNQSSIFRTNRFVADMTPPQLLAFSIDMDLGQLMLSFDETVMEASLTFDFLALRNNASGSFTNSTQHQFTGGNPVSPDSDVITIQLSVDDLNEVKRKDLCRRSIGAADCYLVMQTEAIQDMAENRLQGCRRL
ncbi:uncharacterized protein [Dysidea avara]|uniref:uncharacterized protein n=1 Tax=Dysidea avara TaxID=196820 RepID=UPI00331898B9